MTPSFSLDRVATPAKGRRPPELPLVESRKVPRVDDLLIVQGPRPPAPKRLPNNGDIILAIYKYTDDAAAAWEDVKEHGVMLWQVQIQHEVRDSICFQIQEKFNEFLAQRGSGGPNNLADMQQKALIKLVVTDGQDPDGVGTFQRWRPAFYVAGSDVSLKNLLYLLDEWWVFLMKDKDVFTNIWIHPHVNVDIDECWDNFQYPAYTLEERTSRLPIGVLEAQPPQGKRILLITFQVERESVLSCVFQNTWNFRDAIEAHGIPGLRDDNKKYYRVVQSVDVASESGKQRLLSVLGIFQNLVAHVTVEGKTKSGEPVHAFLRDLRTTKPHLHFA